MKKRKKLFLAWLLIAGVMLVPGCGVKSSGAESENTITSLAKNKAVEKKSDYVMSSATYYDADGTCTMEVMYEYDETGREVHRVQQSYGDFEWKDESFFAYPDAVTRQQTFIDMNTGSRSQVDTIVYDESGNIKTETSTDYGENGSEDLMRKIEYNYDKNGNLIFKEEHSTATVGNELNHISRTEYTYDKAGNRLTEKLTNYTEGEEDQVKVFTDSEYEYDNRGNKIREKSNLSDDHTYSPILYEYDRKDQRTKELDYASTAPDTLKQYFIYEYDENGNRIKYSRYSSEDQLLSYAEFEYIKIGEIQPQKTTNVGADGLYKTWKIDGTASSTISFEFIDPDTEIRFKVENYDIRTQQEGVGGMSTSVETTDNTIEVFSGPEQYTNFSYWFEADGALKMKDESTGNIISLHVQ